MRSCGCCGVSPFYSSALTLGSPSISPFLGRSDARWTILKVRPRPRFRLLPHPYSSSTTMALPLIPLLQRQLETTLQVLISVSSEMTNDDIMLLRIRLHEAALIMGDIVVERSNSAANGNSMPTSKSTILMLLQTSPTLCLIVPQRLKMSTLSPETLVGTMCLPPTTPQVVVSLVIPVVGESVALSPGAVPVLILLSEVYLARGVLGMESLPSSKWIPIVTRIRLPSRPLSVSFLHF